MIKTGVSRATRQFFLTTTLHGFKYLYSESRVDRICWLSWCIASACCAGTLCAVLWTRFLHVPALLTLRTATSVPQSLPTVGICLPAQSVAYLLIKYLSKDKDVTRRLIATVTRILEDKEGDSEQLLLLEQMLAAHNITMLEALYKNTPPCHEYVKRCRWRSNIVPCDQLFHRELTQLGVCCVMQPSKIKNAPREVSIFESNERLSLVLQCSNSSLFYSCQFFTKYEAQETTDRLVLSPGFQYQVKLTFTSVQDSVNEQLVADYCESTADYSRIDCLNGCMERTCGCSNPLRTTFDDADDVLPPCPMSRINYLKWTDNLSCSCLPACETLTTKVSIQDSPMKSAANTIDPLYSELNVSAVTVVELRVLVDGSRAFTRKPTETWVTLLSSLGGIFNMFLGVGLFSALEFMFFIIVKLPEVIKKAPEMDLSVTHVHSRARY